MSQLQVLVRGMRLEAQGICAYELTHPEGGELPAYAAGAHIDVHLPRGLVRSYSLAGDPADRTRWWLGVLREAKSQGGSEALHEAVRVGDRLTVSLPRNAFALAANAAHSVLLAGGIGITPLKSMAHALVQAGASFELHYCARGPQHAAFADALRALIPNERLHFHFDGGEPGKGLDIKALLKHPAPGAHVYFCGPGGFMRACAEASAHWPAASVHSEYFKAPGPIGLPTSVSGDSGFSDGGFDVHLLRSGDTIHVGPDQTIVRAIELTGRRVPTSCLSGLCGACKVNYVEGDVDHQDYILNDEERKTCLTLCVSRARSASLTIDL